MSPMTVFGSLTGLTARRVSIVSAVMTFACAVLPAQEARVYSANSSNGQIVLVTFDPPGTTVVNTDANQRTSLRALAIRDDGVDGIHLIVCDTNGGEVVFYGDAAGNGEVVASAEDDGPALPDGVSIDSDGNLALVTSGPGNSGAKTAQVWVVLRDPACDGGGGGSCLPGGYRAPLG